MVSPRLRLPLSRRGFLLATAGAGAALGLAPTPARAAAASLPFGRYGSPAARLNAQTLYVDSSGQGDFTSVQAAVSAASGSGWTLVIAPGTYRKTVSVDRSREIGPALRTASTPRLSAGVRTLRDVAVPVTDLSATARSWGAWPGWTTQLPSTTGAG